MLTAAGLLAGCTTLLVLPGVASAQTCGPPSCYCGCSPSNLIQTGAAGSVSGATSVHTGEPWAGSTPEVVGVGLGGGALIATGLVLRRRRRQAASS